MAQTQNEKELYDALEAVLNSIISGGSGAIAPTFDAEDREVENRRGAWSVIDQKAIDRARATIEKARDSFDA